MDMTIEFEEFVDLPGVGDEQFVGEHWMHFYDTCFPCSIHHDAGSRRLNNADLSLDPASKLSAVRRLFGRF
ncbi:hypothetical protein LSH36_572g00007 [Paralvinella palmiformis]|uniref:Uncharacterized protein n=1 Tax=Paralvinella palmiformis TaxID=53620 RepID=A0AAD9J7E6_9ANNE|nr:hypothetical protein LSH36_572g00007 [Paralvinella palmiformis]